jgi:uncharacterized protein YqeY
MSARMEQLMQDIKTAMKAGEKERLTTLRSLHAQIKDATVNAGLDLTDEAFVAVVAKQLKQRADAATQYRDAGRPELADIEDRESEILRAYQPAQLDEATLSALIDEAIAASGATSRKEMGKVMGLLMPKVKGQADGTLVNRLVAAKLP